MTRDAVSPTLNSHCRAPQRRKNLEHRAGIEPANTGFADQRVSHFATGAHLALRQPRSSRLPSEFTYFAWLARSFFARYHVSTARPAPPPLVRLRASSTVTRAGTITESPTFQLAGTETPLPSIVCSASKIRISSSTLRPNCIG